MRFEQAIKAMREGKKVKRPKRSCPITIIDNEIVEVYHEDFIGSLQAMNCVNIMAEDWEIVDDKQ